MRNSPLYLLLPVLLLFAVGCQSTNEAMSTLDRSYKMIGDLSKDQDETARLALRYAQAQSIKCRFLETELALQKQSTNGQIDMAKVSASLMSLREAEIAESAKLDNFRDRLAYLAVQAEKLKALQLNMYVFVNGKRSILDLLTESVRERENIWSATAIVETATEGTK